VALDTVTEVVGVPPNPIRLYFIPSDSCVPQLAACKS
jgi:hypothetical protein